MQKGSFSKAGVAQLVEQRTRNAKVGGSTPLPGTIFTTGQGGHMLILTRRIGETIIIETPSGEQIQVTVLP